MDERLFAAEWALRDEKKNLLLFKSRAFHPKQWRSGLFKRKIKDLQIKSKTGLIWFLEKLQPQIEHSQCHLPIKACFSFLRRLLFDNIKRICLPDLSVHQRNLFEHGKTNPHLFNAFSSSRFFFFFVCALNSNCRRGKDEFQHWFLTCDFFSGVWLTGTVADQVYGAVNNIRLLMQAVH